MVATTRSATAQLERPLTEDDFWSLPDDENRYEIIAGELHVTPPPVSEHQSLSQYLNVAFYYAVELLDLGWVRVAPSGVRITATDILQPDVLLLSSARSEGPSGTMIIDLPEMVVEILSPSTRQNDLTIKWAQYQAAGIPEYWIVDPAERRVMVLTLDGDQYTVVTIESGIARSRSFPSIGIDVLHLFSGNRFVPATTPSTTG